LLDLLDPVRTMRLYTMDAWVSDPSVLTDKPLLQDALYRGARAGGAAVLGETFCTFPNGAVTGVLVLAQSHLSIHTWPELSLANVDLLSYGDVSGNAVLEVIRELLGVERAAVTSVPRAVA
jgi:S-adenosylmethionine decarboxylase